MRKKAFWYLAAAMAVLLVALLIRNQDRRSATSDARGDAQKGEQHDKSAATGQISKESMEGTSILHPGAALQLRGAIDGRPLPALSTTGGGDLPPPEEPPPARAKATITVGKKVFTPQNLDGKFERLVVVRSEKIPISVAWPEDKTSTEVLVHAIHGGSIDGGGNFKRFALGDNKGAEFSFTAGAESGLYEVLLRRGTKEEVLEFWVPTNQPQFDPPALQ